MHTEIRFSCPACGQHFSAEGSCEGRQITCSTCQAQFTVSGSAVVAGDPKPPVPAAPALRVPARSGSAGHPRQKGTCPWTGTFCGLLTPLALAIAAGLCVRLSSVMGRPGRLLGVGAAGVGIAYLTNRFTKWYLLMWGSEAFEYYKKSASTAFLFLPAVVVIIFLSRVDEGAGLMIVPVTVGLYFFSIMLAGAWLAGIKWARWHE